MSVYDPRALTGSTTMGMGRNEEVGEGRRKEGGRKEGREGGGGGRRGRRKRKRKEGVRKEEGRWANGVTKSETKKIVGN